MANPQNLKAPWKPGQTGNAKGRPPKGQTFDDLIGLIDKTPKGREMISKMWFKEILRGNYAFFREYIERTDGKVASKVEVEDTRPDYSGLPETDDPEGTD